VGTCNICGAIGQLTWDHVPPKGVFGARPVEIRRLFQAISRALEDSVLESSQNGVKFRTICGRCNSLLLGSRYDPFLQEACNSLRRFLLTNLIMPPEVSVEVNSYRVAKSVIGHLLAAKVTIDGSQVDIWLRKWFLGDDQMLPNGLRLIFWPYPYDQVRVAQDFLMPSRPGSFDDTRIFKLMSFFPLAFLLTDAEDYACLPSLSEDLRDENQTIKIKLSDIKDPIWPITTDGNNFYVFGASGESALLAQPKIRK
jgi:hypothetical protein